MKKIIPLFSYTALAGLVLVGCGTDDQADASAETEQAAEGELFAVDDPWIKATEESLDEASDDSMTSAFAHLTNVSGDDQTITGASADIADMVELHEMVDDGGVNVMQEKEGGFPVADGETYELNPGEDHIMLMELTEEINPGDSMNITLELDNGETQDIEFIAKEFVGAQENYGDLEHHDDGHGDEEDDADHDH